MNRKITIFTLMAMLITGVSYGARFEYTWRDKNGTLNISDAHPPDGVEIIDISKIPMPEVREAPPEKSPQDVQAEREATRKRLLARAAELRKEKDILLQKAADLNDEAQEQLRISRLHRHKFRYNKRAEEKEEQAAAFLDKANTLERDAKNLEDEASRLE